MRVVRVASQWSLAIGILVLGAGLGAATAPAAAETAEMAAVTVFAAASLKTALDEACAVHDRETGMKTVVSYAASSALAKQIEQGAPADVFISADLAWMDDLAGKGLVRPDSRVNLAGNRLVLVAPAASDLALTIAPGFALAAALADDRLAVADVKAVPAGRYAKAALESLGVWSSVETRLAPAENVRAALAFVAQGEAPLGIVYRTDARAEPRVRVVGTFPAASHPPIVYPAAVTTASAVPEAARALLAFLRSAKGAEILEQNGFDVPKPN
jgi:molybdate transport system substrate-binding protein